MYVVKEKIKILNKERVIEMAKQKQYKKVSIETLSADDFIRKSYLSEMNVSDARIRFKVSSHMLQTVKMNFQSDPEYKGDLWSCDDCGKIDTQKHLLHCEGYSAFRQDKNLSLDADLVSYVKSVLKHRLDNM